MKDKNNSIFRTVIVVSIIGGLVILIAIYLQLVQMNDNNRVNLTYKIYQDLQNWENSNPEASNWIKNYDEKDSIVLLMNNFDKWKFDDYLGF